MKAKQNKDARFCKVGVTSKYPPHKGAKSCKRPKKKLKRKTVLQNVNTIAEIKSNQVLDISSPLDAVFENLHKLNRSPATGTPPKGTAPLPSTSPTAAIPLKKPRSERAVHLPAAQAQGGAVIASAPPLPRSACGKNKRRKLNRLKRLQKRQRDSAGSETVQTKLESARFRYLNEQLYTRTGQEAMRLFSRDPDAYEAYHQGFRNQVAKWPVNPLDLIIQNVNKMPRSHLVVDLGCGEARLAASVRQRVLSYDLVAVNDRVTACDIARLPLPDAGADVAVLCLALMGTNAGQCLSETNRVLRDGGQLRVAEVASRFDDVEAFVATLKEYGFKLISQDLSHKYFYLFSLRKACSIPKKRKDLPVVELKPCLYKRR